MAPTSQDAPCDFLTYLEERLKKDRGAAAQLLGEWLASYEPVERRLARTNARSAIAQAEVG